MGEEGDVDVEATNLNGKRGLGVSHSSDIFAAWGRKNRELKGQKAYNFFDFFQRFRILGRRRHTGDDVKNYKGESSFSDVARRFSRQNIDSVQSRQKNQASIRSKDAQSKI